MGFYPLVGIAVYGKQKTPVDTVLSRYLSPTQAKHFLIFIFFIKVHSPEDGSGWE